MFLKAQFEVILRMDEQEEKGDSNVLSFKATALVASD